MKFDVIIGNPPYQLSAGNEGANAGYSRAIYHLFIDKAIELKPNYITMITPSRWMTGNAEGVPKEWIRKMIASDKLKIIHDFENADSVFSNVLIRGGVSYFLWDSQHNEACSFHYELEDGSILQWKDKLNVFGSELIVRDPRFHSIVNKVIKKHPNIYKNTSNNFSSFVSPSHFYDKGGIFGTGWRDYKLEKDDVHNIKYYVPKSKNGVSYGWVSKKQIPRNDNTINMNRVYIPGTADPSGVGPVLGIPFYGEPNSVSSQSYLVIGYDVNKHNLTKEECENIITYIKTKFFRFLVKAKQSTQSAPRGVYEFVPIQDFSKSWTDKELYNKYELSQEEIEVIEETVTDMPSSEN